MSNVQAQSIPFNSHASLLIGKDGAGLFVKLHQKTRPGPNITVADAEQLAASHFLLAVYGETPGKLAAAGTILIPGRKWPFAAQMAGIQIPQKTAVLCLAAYSTKLMGLHSSRAQDGLMAGARLLAQGHGCTALIELGNGKKQTIHEPWQVISMTPL